MCIYVYAYICMCMYAYICMCMRIYVCVCAYMYVYAYIRLNTLCLIVETELSRSLLESTLFILMSDIHTVECVGI